MTEAQSKVQINCDHCGLLFSAWPSQERRYCSLACYWRSLNVSLDQRVWPRVVKGDGCWLWTNETNGVGYGRIRPIRGGKWAYVHRLVWEWTNGPIPDKRCVLHHCDVRNCVRPDHLFIGTKRQNTADMMGKGRFRNGSALRRGERRAKLTPEQALEIRARYAAGERPTRLASEYGVRYQTIWKIATGRRWAKAA